MQQKDQALISLGFTAKNKLAFKRLSKEDIRSRSCAVTNAVQQKLVEWTRLKTEMEQFLLTGEAIDICQMEKAVAKLSENILLAEARMLEVEKATKILVQSKEILELTRGHYWQPGFTAMETRRGQQLWTDHVTPGVRKLITLKHFMTPISHD